MEDTASVACPFCGRENELVVDPSQREACFVTDCEVCCRPFEVRVLCRPGEIPVLEVVGT
jgi:hypothetical protein